MGISNLVFEFLVLNEGAYKMKAKCTVFTVLAVFLVLAINSASIAVSTGEIGKVRSKGVLDAEDLQIIDDFVAEAVQELVKTEDFTSIARVRTVILSRTSSGTDSAAAQYSEQFYESAYKHISSGLEAAESLTPKERRCKATLNLLILADALEDVRLADLGIKMLNDENEVIRYWAVHSITNAGIIRQLNAAQSTNPGLPKRIVRQLTELVGAVSPEITGLMAKFAADVGIVEAEDLLIQIVDMRISRYANWTVEYELLDGVILKLLYNKISSSDLSRASIDRRFCQLYSYVMQRYVKGRDFLSDAQKHQLASVLLETEKSCISKLLEMPQSTIKRAVEQDNLTGLLSEHSRLLGDETGAGRLPLKLNFDYGKDIAGNTRTAPLVLPIPPGTRTSGQQI